MVNTRNDRVDPESSQANGNPPPTMAQAIASVMELRDEQTKLLCLPVAISNHGGHGAGNACSQALSTYTEFLATHPSTFAEAR
jgi:hypothetical protein